jgi:hypothetical protein
MKFTVIAIAIVTASAQLANAAEPSAHNPTGSDEIEQGYTETRDRILRERAYERAFGERDTRSEDRSENNEGHYNRPESDFNVRQDQDSFQVPCVGPSC